MRTGAGQSAFHLVRWVILAWCVIGIVQLAVTQLPLISLHESVGYGDSYIFYTVENFRQTGILYPPVGPDHLTPVLYSPLLYLMHFAAWLAVPAANPYLGPRLLELFWFLACVFMAGALTRRLIPARSSFTLGILLAASYSMMIPWVLQLRADFPGITCSLLTLWFLTSRGRRSIIFAGICAGLALQFKITFVAAAVAGCAWLIFYRRWRALAEFAVATGVFSVGLYAAFWWREPEMLRQMLTLKKVPPHLPGLVVFFRQLVAEPGVLLALAGLLPMFGFLLARQRPRLQLMLIFVMISASAATLASLQPGASLNYFYEAIFAATPFAVLALLRLEARASLTASLLVALVLLTTSVLPRASHTRVSKVAGRNQNYEDLRHALSGVRLVSSVPDVTFLTPDPVITEPYLLTDLSMAHGVDLSPLTDKISQQYFDLAVTHPANYSWRGIPQLEPGLRSAITASYVPYCLRGDDLFHLPKDRPPLALEEKLRSIGCEVVTCGPGTKCPGLSVAIEAFK